MSNITACLSTGKDTWETPQDLFDTYNYLFDFILDAAADEVNHKVDLWLGPGSGIAEDALAVEWKPWLEKGNIWLNPPYSRGLQAAFVRKAAQEAKEWGGKIVCLLPSRTDTKLFHEVIWPHADVTFLKGRVTFKGAPAPAPFPSLIAIFG